MRLHYLRDRDIDLAASVVIGDRETDMQLAQNLGCRGLRLAPGHHDWAQIAHLLADAPRTAQVQRTTRETDIHVSIEIGRAHVLTPVTNAHLVCRLLLEKKK